ncbi:MFS antiporter QDR2 [Madurella mycetomatis]|uniref:MFS antiporter QDR2 n=1 Tax=Madurella mycetomatis TaxID=100816 RepID=A0A175WD77_9PEZI|nr:MFS antiporter QDR2 [Madurella mycetomatis]
MSTLPKINSPSDLLITPAPAGRPVSPSPLSSSPPTIELKGKDDSNHGPQPEPSLPFPKLSTRTYLTYLLGFTITLSTLTATIYFPLIPLLTRQFSVPLQSINLTVTAYAVAQALAPALFASLADAGPPSRPAHPRRPSVGGSPTPAIAYGIVADVAPLAERGAMLGPMMSFCNGLSAVGPVVGGAVALATAGVEWVFLALLVVAVVVLVGVGGTMPETLAGRRRREGRGGGWVKGWVRRPWWELVAGLGKGGGGVGEMTVEDAHRRATKWRAREAVASFRFILHKDAFAVLWMVASSYTVYYTFQVAIPVIFDEIYGYNELEIGLVFLPGLAGMTIGGIIAGKLVDQNYAITARRHGFEPGVKLNKKHDLCEFPIESARYRHCLIFVFLEVAVVIGYGWAVWFRVHPAVPIVLQFFACALSTLLSHTASALLVDIFPDTSSSAYASGQLMRCGLSAASAAVLQPLVDAVGRGWYFTMFSLFLGLTGAASVIVSQVKGMKWRRARLN